MQLFGLNFRQTEIDTLEKIRSSLKLIKICKKLIKEAEQNNPEAQFELGVIYDEVKEYEEAVKWYSLSANQGFTQAQHNLAMCYRNGLGVTQDHQTAIELSLLAAEKGLPEAQFNVGQNV